MTQSIDHSEIKFGQIMVILFMITAYILDLWQIVAVTGIFFFLSAISMNLGPFNNLYRILFRSTGIIKPDMRMDHSEPHRFGQAVGFLTAVFASILITSGYTLSGWIVVGVLTGLTAVSFAGWCIGCFIYYMLNKMGIQGFFRHAPADADVITGARPRKKF